MKKLDVNKLLKQPRYLVETNVRIAIKIVLETENEKVVNNFLIDNCTISLCKPVSVDKYLSILAIQFTELKQIDESCFPKTDLTIEKSSASIAKLKVNIRVTNSQISYSVINCTVLNPFVLHFCTSDALDEVCFLLGSKEKNYWPTTRKDQTAEYN